MTAIGARVWGLGAIALGAVELRYGAFSADWLPVPAHLFAYQVLVWAAAGLLIAGGVLVNLRRPARFAALGLAGLFALGMTVFLLPPVLAKPAVWGGWQGVAESTVMLLGGLLAWTQSPGADRAAAVARIARWVFGACLLVFGTSHFVYAKFTASLVPAWLPPSQMFWVYATGVAQIAAAVAMLTGVRARLAAVLLTVMYVAFGVLVHLPSVIAVPWSLDNWTENAINFILTGAAWALADSLARAKARG